MAKWKTLEIEAEILSKIKSKFPDVWIVIRNSAKYLDKHPEKGKRYDDDKYLYDNELFGFTLGYTYHTKENEIVVSSFKIFKK